MYVPMAVTPGSQSGMIPHHTESDSDFRILYPSSLTRKVQFILGGVVIAANLIIYGYVFFISKSKGGKF